MVDVFAGEDYLGVDLPDYQQEGRNLVLGFVAVAVLFFVVLPGVLAGPQGGRLSMPTHVVLNLSGLVGLLWVLLQSSQNSLIPRLVVEAPLLTPQECQSLMERAHKAAIANVFQHKMNNQNNNAFENDNDNEEEEVDPLLKEPAGWRKDRHSSYPTVDLNVVTDPFTKEDREWLEGILNRRLTPILQRVYGVSPASIRANDMFVVRYDGDVGQNRLNKHTDSGHISFNVLLNDAFEGGGTRFHNRLQPGVVVDAHPAPGRVLLNNAVMLHEGLPTTAGTRYIFVGFTNIDTMDPFTKQPTGLSVFSSWLSLPWIQRRFDEAHQAVQQSPNRKWYYNKYTKALFQDIYTYFTLAGDHLAPHGHLSLVQDPTNQTLFLQALDDHAKQQQQQQPKANWFAGQQVVLDVDGTVSREWNTRLQNMDRFSEL